MLSRMFLKRIVPFVVTLAFGLLVASLFINIAPTFKFKKKKSSFCRNQVQTFRYENERLRLENQRLRQKLDMVLIENDVPPPAVAPQSVEVPVDDVPLER